ncbi:prolyl oligopeptidase family serine peptidase [Micromonospora sp. NPDC049523]|uniref:S9 family peptidase n=1 Tax=Micromonospora sp. NPDC049523 TaxID=3155921 RepID=UPI0034241F6F
MPLTADEVARVRRSYDWLAGLAGGLHWVESSPRSGKAVVASWWPSPGSRTRVSELPADSVGSTLHAYGGMPYGWLPSHGMVLVDASAGQLHGVAGLPATAHSYGDLAGSGDELLCVREDDGGDELVAIEPATGTCRVLRATDGFLASPTPGRDRLAWVQWDRAVMPWDSSEIWIADRTAYGSIGRPRRVAGGPDESAVQPRWGEDGALYFLSDRSGWWNLYRWSVGGTEALAPMDVDCARAPWESTYADYVLLPENRIGMVVQRGPSHHLVLVEPDGEVVRIELPYTSIKPYLAALGSRIALIGSSPTRAQEVVLVETDGSDKIEIIRAGTDRADLAAVLSIPEVMRFSSAGIEVTGLFYPAATGGAPAPLIVRPHPGPTHQSNLRLDWEVQFFTSRGFAVVDVDYRGSTGYGRQFRKALDGHWGRFDVEDCRTVALHLIENGSARRGAVFISGASAGGYTALRAVSEDGPFALAVARSAIVDPGRWTVTAPRFQRPHAAVLAGADGRVAATEVLRPVLLIHGVEDPVAPIADVIELADALNDRQLLVRMIRLDGVGHYLSDAATLSAALEAELDAYRAVLRSAGISPAE